MKNLFSFLQRTTSKGWFQKLFGFEESTALNIKDNFIVSCEHNNDVLESKLNGRKFNCGKFSTPSLRSLRSKIPNSVNFDLKGKRYEEDFDDFKISLSLQTIIFDIHMT